MSVESEEEMRYKRTQIDFFNEFSKKISNSKNKDLFYRFFLSMDEKRVRYAEDTIIKIMGKIPTKGLILEIGCGRGEHTLLAATTNKEEKIVSIDASLESIKTTKKILENQKIENIVSFVLCDAENLPFKSRIFDGVMNIMVLHHVPDFDMTLNETSRVIKDGGTTVIVEITTDSPIREFSKRIFTFLPKRIKDKVDSEYVLGDGEIPQITPFSSENLRRHISQNDLNIVRNEKHVLFLSYIFILAQVFPFTKYFFSERVLESLFKFERFLLERTFLKKYGEAVVYWAIKQ